MSRGWSRRRPDDDPVSLAAALDEVRADLGMPALEGLAALVGGWSELVGPEIAAHTRVDGVRAGTVLVLVDHPAWATQLRYLEATIVERARSLLGAAAVTGVRWRIDVEQEGGNDGKNVAKRPEIDGPSGKL